MVVIIMVKFIDQWKFKLSGRAVPVIKVEDIDASGRIMTLHWLGHCKKRANSIISTWDAKGWEIDPRYGPIRYIDDKGIESQIYIVSESGVTSPLATEINIFPNREDAIGKAATMDDVVDAMDLGKSVRNFIIGALISAPVWYILFQMIGVMAK
jgi:hypothetical protein